MSGPGENGVAPFASPPLDVLTVNGVAIDLVAWNAQIDHLVPFARGAFPSLGFSRLVRIPGALPDPWNLRPCTLTMMNTVVFSGLVTGYIDRYERAVGWLREYRALGLAWAGNYIAVTDEMNFTDTSVWNRPADDPAMIASRAGQTVGAIVADILTMAGNASNLAAYGIGAYVSLSPPTLPALTLGDLAALTVIPPWVVRVSGERILPALEQFVRSCHPNHFLHVQPDGTIRFLDPRTFADVVITINDPSDIRWDMPELTRDASDNYSQIIVRGNTLVRAFTLQDDPWSGSAGTDGGLAEDFAHDGLTNAQAKAAWVPSDWSQPNQSGAPMEAGPCTPIDTTHVTIQTTRAYAADQLAQGAGEALGWVNLQSDSLGGLVEQFWLARVIANTASSGSAGAYSCVVTIDAPLPALTYNSFQLFGLAAGANVVGRRYRVTNPALAHTLQNAFPYPVPYMFAGGMGAEMVSSPMGVVMLDPTGQGHGPPWASSTVGITVDPEGGLIYFDQPVQVVTGGLSTPVRWPSIVQAFVACAVGALEVVAPASGFAGTLYTVEGVRRTKVITALDWRDQSNNLNMQIYANEVLDSCKDVVIEGSVPYQGMPGVAWLSPGRQVSIAGHDFTTGWESIALPVVAVEIAFQNGAYGTSYQTVLRVSNRRTPYDASNFLRPGITGQWIGARLDSAFGAGLESSRTESAALVERSLQMTAEGTRAPVGFTGQVGGADAFTGALAASPGTMAAGLAGAAGATAEGFGTTAVTAAAGTMGPVRQYNPVEVQEHAERERRELETADKERRRVQEERREQQRDRERREEGGGDLAAPGPEARGPR